MGLLSRLFGKKQKNKKVRERKNEPDVIDVATEDEKMNWAIEKSQITLHYFESCLKAPNPNQQYFSIKVKIVDGEKAEHIWLNDPTFDEDGNLFGVVGNNPIDVTNVSFNQKIGIDRNLISDWMIIENGTLIGGYTIRALRDKLEGRALKDFDKGLGGMHVDEGEDYFLADLTTPEGAIVSIEEAYNEDNLDKVLACKDFDVEARFMFSKMAKEAMTGEVIDKGAELLKLSFLKALQESGMPKFNGVKRAFPKREKISDKHMVITEVCKYPDGSKSSQRLNTCKTDSGWKVLSPAD